MERLARFQGSQRSVLPIPGTTARGAEPDAFRRRSLSTRALLTLGLLAASILSGCSAHRTGSVIAAPVAEATTPTTPPRTHIEAETQRISGQADRHLGTNAYNAEELFYEGQRRFGAEELEVAVEIFQRVLDEFPDSRYVAPSLLMLGRSLIDLDRPAEALPHFQRYLEVYPTGRQRYMALLGQGDAHAALKDWTASEKDFRALLELPGLTTPQRDNGRARLARAEIEQGRLDGTVPLLEEIATRFPPISRDADGDNREVGALARFYVGEVKRRQAEAVVLGGDINVEQTSAALEEKSLLTLDAHQHYYRTFSYSLPDYTAVAAYQMAYLYERFYSDLLNSPPPPQLDAEEVALYREMLDEQLVNVVKKATDLYSQVIRHADKFQLKPEWVEKCREGIARLESQRQTVKGGLGPVPASPAQTTGTIPAPLPAQESLPEPSPAGATPVRDHI